MYFMSNIHYMLIFKTILESDLNKVINKFDIGKNLIYYKESKCKEKKSSKVEGPKRVRLW